jgi:hypothetical protein
LDAPAGISTGKRRSIAEIQGLVEERRRAYEMAAAVQNKEVIDAAQSTLGWNTIYFTIGARCWNSFRIWSPNGRHLALN